MNVLSSQSDVLADQTCSLLSEAVPKTTLAYPRNVLIVDDLLLLLILILDVDLFVDSESAPIHFPPRLLLLGFPFLLAVDLVSSRAVLQRRSLRFSSRALEDRAAMMKYSTTYHPPLLLPHVQNQYLHQHYATGFAAEDVVAARLAALVAVSLVLLSLHIDYSSKLQGL